MSEEPKTRPVSIEGYHPEDWDAMLELPWRVYYEARTRDGNQGLYLVRCFASRDEAEAYATGRMNLVVVEHTAPGS